MRLGPAGPPTNGCASSTSLPRKLAKPRLDALERGFGLNAIRNSEVRFAWLDLAVANRYDPAVPSLEEFLTTQGRRKFVRPLIKALAADTALGPADRGADLCQGPAALPPDGDRANSTS